jgi:hypothetical protein
LEFQYNTIIKEIIDQNTAVGHMLTEDQAYFVFSMKANREIMAEHKKNRTRAPSNRKEPAINLNRSIQFEEYFRLSKWIHEIDGKTDMLSYKELLFRIPRQQRT